jgi:4-amino-4-deoxy-L-arabinose transferase-like glycosyltransferase
VFWTGVAAVAAGLAGVLAWLLHVWPPHEDETLTLFVGRSSFADMLDTVITERGGAPLHFVVAWVVVHLDGGLTALRAVSLLFAVACVPLIALLGARLAGDTAGLVAAALASGTWMLLFNGVFARMYSLFLFTSLLSFLALLSALERGGTRRFALWAFATLAMLATHPYALLVVAAQVLFTVLRRRHVREALITLGAIGVAGIPLWWADVVLRNRFDVGIGGGGRRLGSPAAVLEYLWHVAGDVSTGHAWAIPVLCLALAGGAMLWRGRRGTVVLAACVLAVPAVVFMLATLGASTSPESRHLIFVLPFFSLLMAVPISRLAPALAIGAVALLLVGEAAWAHRETPLLFEGDPRGEAHARDAAAAWLATTARPDDVLLGYEPVYLRAWELNRSFSRHALPRADPALFAAALNDVPEPLGRGVWVFDASDTTNVWERQTIEFGLPKPTSTFEGHAWGPYLVIRSRRPLISRARYLDVAKDVLRFGRGLQITDADVNLHTILQAQSRL